MRKAALVLAGLFAAEAAIACVCLPVDDPELRRDTAARIAAESSAVATIEQVRTPDDQQLLYRVHKVHSGAVPARFRLARVTEETASGTIVLATSCDVVPPPGEPTIAVLYPSSEPGSFGIGGTCEHLFVNSPGAIELIRDEARKLASSAERG